MAESSAKFQGGEKSKKNKAGGGAF